MNVKVNMTAKEYHENLERLIHIIPSDKILEMIGEVEGRMAKAGGKSSSNGLYLCVLELELKKRKEQP